MPTLFAAYPKYRKHKQSGQAIVTLNGRDFLLGPHGTRSSRDQYDRLIGEWTARGRQLAAAAEDGLTVAELIASYWKHVTAYYVKGGKPTTEVAAIRSALKPLRELYGRTPAAEFGPVALEAVRFRMIDADWSRGTINKAVNRIRACFDWGVAKQLLPPAVKTALDALKVLHQGRTSARESSPVMPVDDSTVDATLPHLPAIVADMVRLQRLTAMRPAEVCMVRPCDLDRRGEVWLYRPESHKTEHHGRERTIYVGPKAQAVLLRFLARDAQSYCFRPCDSMAKHLAERAAARVTPISSGNSPGTNRTHKPRTKPGESYEVDAYRRAITRGCDKAFPHPSLAGIPIAKLTAEQVIELRTWQSAHRWAPNQLRHTTATEVRREFGLEAAQIMLGHSKADVTQVYAERDMAKGLEVARQIG